MAHKEFFGDSYQYAHRVLLHCILPSDQSDRWIVHPILFREKGGGLDVAKYAKFLGVDHGVVLESGKDGSALTGASLVKDVGDRPGPYVFLDPDTGIDFGKLDPKTGVVSWKKDQEHVRVKRLADIAKQTGRKIVLVFDHAYERERFKVNERSKGVPIPHSGKCKARKRSGDKCEYLCGKCKTMEQVTRRLRCLCAEHGLHCAALIVRTGTSVNYVWVSTKLKEVTDVTSRIRRQLPMPCWRLVSCPCSAKPS